MFWGAAASKVASRSRQPQRPSSEPEIIISIPGSGWVSHDHCSFCILWPLNSGETPSLIHKDVSQSAQAELSQDRAVKVWLGSVQEIFKSQQWQLCLQSLAIGVYQTEAESVLKGAAGVPGLCDTRTGRYTSSQAYRVSWTAEIVLAIYKNSQLSMFICCSSNCDLSSVKEKGCQERGLTFEEGGWQAGQCAWQFWTNSRSGWLPPRMAGFCHWWRQSCFGENGHGVLSVWTSAASLQALLVFWRPEQHCPTCMDKSCQRIGLSHHPCISLIQGIQSHQWSSTLCDINCNCKCCRPSWYCSLTIIVVKIGSRRSSDKGA